MKFGDFISFAVNVRGLEKASIDLINPDKNIINDQGKVNTILDLKTQLRSLIVEYKDTEALQILNSN